MDFSEQFEVVLKKSNANTSTADGENEENDISQEKDVDDNNQDDENDIENPFSHSFYDSDQDSSSSSDDDSSTSSEEDSYTNSDSESEYSSNNDSKKSIEKSDSNSEDIYEINDINVGNNSDTTTFSNHKNEYNPILINGQYKRALRPDQSSFKAAETLDIGKVDNTNIGDSDDIHNKKFLTFKAFDSDERLIKKFDANQFIQNVLKEKAAEQESKTVLNHKDTEFINSILRRQTPEIADKSSANEKKRKRENTDGDISFSDTNSTFKTPFDKTKRGKKRIVVADPKQKNSTSSIRKIDSNSSKIKYFFENNDEQELEEEMFRQMAESMEIKKDSQVKLSNEEDDEQKKYMYLIYESVNLTSLIDKQESSFNTVELESEHVCCEHRYECYTSFAENTELEEIGSSRKFNASGNVYICRKTKHTHICFGQEGCDESVISEGSNYCPISKKTFGQVFNYSNNLSSLSKIETNKYEMPILLPISKNTNISSLSKGSNMSGFEKNSILKQDSDIFGLEKPAHNNDTIHDRKTDMHRRRTMFQMSENNSLQNERVSGLQFLKQLQKPFEFSCEQVCQDIIYGRTKYKFITKMFLPFAKQRRKSKKTNYIYIVDQKTTEIFNLATDSPSPSLTDSNSNVYPKNKNKSAKKNYQGLASIHNSRLLACLDECNMLSDKMKRSFIENKEKDDNNIYRLDTIQDTYDNDSMEGIINRPTFSEKYKMSSRKSSSFNFVEDFNQIFHNLNVDTGFMYFYNSQDEQPFYQMMQKFKKMMVHKNKIILVRIYERQRKIVAIRDIYNIYKCTNQLKLLVEYLRDLDFQESLLEEKFHESLREQDEEEEQMYSVVGELTKIRPNNIVFSSQTNDEKSFLETLKTKNENDDMCKSVLIRYIVSSMKHNKLSILNLIVKKNITKKMLSKKILRPEAKLQDHSAYPEAKILDGTEGHSGGAKNYSVNQNTVVYQKIRNAMHAILCAKCILARPDRIARFVEILNNMWTSIFKTPQFSISRNGMRRNNFEKYSIAIISMMNEGFRFNIELFRQKLINFCKLDPSIVDSIDEELLEFNITIIDEMEMIKGAIVHMTVLKNIDPASKSILESEFFAQHEEYLNSLGFNTQYDIENAIFKCLEDDEIKCCVKHAEIPLGKQMKTFCEHPDETIATKGIDALSIRGSKVPLIEKIDSSFKKKYIDKDGDNGLQEFSQKNYDDDLEDLSSQNDILFRKRKNRYAKQPPSSSKRRQQKVPEVGLSVDSEILALGHIPQQQEQSIIEHDVSSDMTTVKEFPDKINLYDNTSMDLGDDADNPLLAIQTIEDVESDLMIESIMEDKKKNDNIKRKKNNSSIEKRFSKSGQRSRVNQAINSPIKKTQGDSMFGRNYPKKTRRTSVNQLKEFIKTEIMICKKNLYLLIRYNVEKINALQIDDKLKKVYTLKKITDLLVDFKNYIKKLEC